MTHLCVSWLSHSSTDAAFLSEVTDKLFSDAPEVGGEKHHRKVCRNRVSNLQPPDQDPDTVPVEIPGRPLLTYSILFTYVTCYVVNVIFSIFPLMFHLTCSWLQTIS